MASLGFLSSLGRGIGGLGKAFAGGVKRLGQADDEYASPNPGFTPDFNPSAGRGVGQGADIRSIEDAVAGAEGAARDSYSPTAQYSDLLLRPGDGASAQPLDDLPGQRMNLPIPQIGPAPQIAGVGSALPAPRRPAPDVVAPPSRAPVPGLPDPLGPPASATRGMDLDRSKVPIPGLPGRGGPLPYNPIDAAKYDSVMKRATITQNPETGENKTSFKRDWKTTLQNALRGASIGASGGSPGDALGRAIGGALGAGAGSALNPQAGYEFAFDVGQRPKLEEAFKREQGEKDRVFQEALRQAQLNKIPIDEENDRAKIDLTRAQTEVARAGIKDVDQQRRKVDAEIALTVARAEAARTLKPVYQDIATPEGGVMKVAVYPDGSMIPIGQSGTAEIKKQDRQSRETVARERNQVGLKRTQITTSGANSRAAAGRAAAKERTQMRIDAGGKARAWKGTKSDAKAKLMQNGYSAAEADAELKKRGIK